MNALKFPFRHPELVEGSVPFVAAVYDRRPSHFSKRRHPELVEGSVQYAFSKTAQNRVWAWGKATDLILRQAQDDGALEAAPSAVIDRRNKEAR